jgi:uracil-DNA glycosylase
MPKSILHYQQECFATYLDLVGLPKDYKYIDGNPIRPLVPVETARHSLMIVGAYPSARFESRGGRLLPVADNLAPFHPELYFDGVRSRKQESAHGLEKFILRPLAVSRSRCWITDLVKVFLFKPEHLSNYNRQNHHPNFEPTRSDFSKYAARSLTFLADEIQLAQPVLILTLGEEVARVVANNFHLTAERLLNGVSYQITVVKQVCTVAHVAHPDACRRSSVWRSRTSKQMRSLRTFLKEKGIVTNSRYGT